MPIYSNDFIDNPLSEGQSMEDFFSIHNRSSNSEDADFGSREISDEELDRLLGMEDNNSEDSIED